MSFKIIYLWDREDQKRVDGVYGDYARQSMFRPDPDAKFFGKKPGFHCGNVPMSLWASCCYPPVKVHHFGYLHREDRIRKFHWYNDPDRDPNNLNEDRYLHMVIGDIPELPPNSVRKHGGPLRLEPL